MTRHIAVTALMSAMVAASFALLPPTALAAPGDAYISNPADDTSLQGFCDDQAIAANNLRSQGQDVRAEEVVGAANMRGCRIFTFESP